MSFPSMFHEMKLRCYCTIAESRLFFSFSFFYAHTHTRFYYASIRRDVSTRPERRAAPRRVVTRVRFCASGVSRDRSKLSNTMKSLSRILRNNERRVPKQIYIHIYIRTYDGIVPFFLSLPLKKRARVARKRCKRNLPRWPRFPNVRDCHGK